MRFQEDHHYIKLIRQGDKQAFGLLVQKHQNLVYTLALRILRNPEEAQEAAQDAFIKVYQSLSSFESKSKFTTWLYRIVYNESLGRLRKTKREFVLVDELMANSEEPADFKDGLEILQQAEESALVKRAIELLNPPEAVVLTLFYMEDLSIKEISGITGNTEPNVKVQLFRGRKHLLAVLQKLTKSELIGSN